MWGRLLPSETPVTYTTEGSSRRAEQNTAVLQGGSFSHGKWKIIVFLKKEIQTLDILMHSSG